MTQEQVIYEGRTVPKKQFRVFIYGLNGEQKLVESWDEYEREIRSGIWFSSKDEVFEKKLTDINKRAEKEPLGKGRK